jgi:hypothetical protein
MWKTRPTHGLVAGWIGKALELSERDSPAWRRAKVAHARWEQNEDDALDAERIAREAGDPELLVHALWARSAVRLNAGDFSGGADFMDAQRGVLPEIVDPDLRCSTYGFSIDTYLSAGRLSDARAAMEAQEPESEALTPHHRLHAAAGRLTVETLTGRWQEARALTARIEGAVEANLATPCPMNIASLFWCALAAAIVGDHADSRRLEEGAYATGMEGYAFATDGPRIWLAVERGNLEETQHLIDGLEPELLGPWCWEIRCALFDALTALGERRRVEEEAPEWIARGGYPRPFARRALGVMRSDATLVEHAAHEFEAMGLAWHAQRTHEQIG